jgi:hypothetical protein
MDIEDWARWKSALLSRAHHNGQWRCGANVSVSEGPMGGWGSIDRRWI